MVARPKVAPADETTFGSWLAEASRGEVLEYHRGFLPIDRHLDASMTAAERAEHHRIGLEAHAALKASEAGKVSLTQRRMGESDFAYRAARR